MKEMVGGCCVCSDERGWAENPLVYCDGQGCTVAVHQACYGIVTVPTGPWFCRKCESQERAARVKMLPRSAIRKMKRAELEEELTKRNLPLHKTLTKMRTSLAEFLRENSNFCAVMFEQRCELCPSKDGALKRTDNGGWAHVVCALYIPEVRFGNVTTMEPIVLQMIPQERFSKVCYICEEQGKGSRANVGACMQCNKSGCKQQFHVTCAQALGLLCEEAGNYLDNVKYCGYCQHHYSKLFVTAVSRRGKNTGFFDVSVGSSRVTTEQKKGGNVKTIPPYKPIPADNGSDSSPEKDLDAMVKSGAGGKRKNSGKAGSTSSGVRTSASGKAGGQSPESLTAPGTSVIEVTNEGSKAGSPSVGKDGSNSAVVLASNSSSGPTKFTTSNFVETVVTQSESVFGTDVPPQVQRGLPGQVPQNVASKKRKSGGSRTPTNGLNFENSSESNSLNGVNLSTSGCPTNPSGPAISTSTHVEGAIMVTDSKKMKVEPGTSVSSVSSTLQSQTESVISNVNCRTTLVPSTNVITSTSCTNSLSNTPTSGIVVSVPLAATSLQSTGPSQQLTVVTSAPTLFQQLQQSVLANNAAMGITTSSTDAALTTLSLPEEQPIKRPRSQPSEKSDKSRKQKRGISASSNPASISSTMSLSMVAAAAAATSAASSSSSTTNKCNGRRSNVDNSPTPPLLSTSHPPAPGTTVVVKELKESPPSSPGSESISSISQCSQRKSKNKRGSNGRDEKDVKLFQNGVSAPHMLGNQLNPSSMMAQKMSDTLSAELEAHSIFDTNSTTSSLVGPQLHSRVIASVRGNVASAQQQQQQPPTSGSGGGGSGAAVAVAGGGGVSNGGGSVVSGNIPQSLEQLLERQWEQGSQFLMEQAQHFDIASLLSCLHQLRAENLRLEEHVNGLVQRRDHLLAVNARLAIPLTSQPATHVNNVHPNAGLPAHPQHQQDPGRGTRINNSYLPPQHPLENGLPPDPSPPTSMGYPHQHRSPITAAGVPVPPVSGTQPSPTIRQNPAGGGYMLSQSPHNPPPPNSNIVSANSATPGVVRSTSGTPESLRGPDSRRASQQSSYVYQVVSSAASSHQSSQVPVVTTQQMVIRRDSSDLHHQMSSNKPS